MFWKGDNMNVNKVSILQ